MLRSKTYLKRTKKGIVKAVQEHYLRDDIWCSVEFCSICAHTQPILSANPATTVLVPTHHYLVPDTNVFFNQIDLIEHPALKDVIVLQTVYEELRHLNLTIYNRLKKVIEDPQRRFYVFSNEHHRKTYVERLKQESPNDRNDRAIREAIKWYTSHLQDSSTNDHKVVLLSDDAANLKKAKSEGLLAYSVEKYVESITETPELVNMLRNMSVSDDSEKKVTYDEYLSSAQIANGLKNGTLYQGTLSISMHNYLEGSIAPVIDGQENQIMIINRDRMNRAIQGDVVAVQLLPRSEWRRTPSAVIVEEDEENAILQDLNEAEISLDQTSNTDFGELQPTGKVVGIIRRNWRSKKTIDSSGQARSEHVTVIPMDRRIPKIRIVTRQARNFLGQRILVAIDSWPKHCMFPQGHFVRTLGAAGDKTTETEVLLLEHDVPFQDFSIHVLSCLPSEGESWKVTNEYQHRMDFRNLNVSSIDPPGCEDIDDALHVRILPNGNYEVGVHIADVTHFVKPGTSLDEEAAVRGTTVYLVNKRVDMLPALLGSNLCSLRAGVERLAFSCMWELNDDADVVKTQFAKSVIISKAALTYEEAQRRIDDLHMQDDLTKGLRILNQLAKKLRGKRIERGALTLASPEVRFKLENDSQDPLDVVLEVSLAAEEMKELRETNALVEEFMLLANISVAEEIFRKFPASSLLRKHPPPTSSKLEKLSKAIDDFGLTLQYDSSKALAESLDKAVIPQEPYFNTLLRILTTRCMMQATYFCSGSIPQKEFMHYGLATQIYTHFTSPIRRYSDIVVHRLLEACIDENLSYGNELTDIKKITQLCEVLNYRHRMAQQAARSSVELHTHLFFKNRKEKNEGFVTRTLKNGFIALIPRYGIEGIVLAAQKPGLISPVVYNTRTNSLDSTSSSTKIKLFDKVLVQISVDEDLVGEGAGGMRQKLRIELVEPFIFGFSVSVSEENNSVRRSDEEIGIQVKRMKMD